MSESTAMSVMRRDDVEVDVLLVAADRQRVAGLVDDLADAPLRVGVLRADADAPERIEGHLARRGVVFVELGSPAGVALIAATKALPYATCVALVEPAEIAAALAAGADDVLVTPWRSADLLARVEVARARAQKIDPELAPWPMHGPDALAVLDDAGIITAWNLAATDLLGHDAREVLGRPFTTLLDELDGVGILAAICGGTSESLGDVRLRRVDAPSSVHTLHIARWRSGDRRRIGVRIDPAADVSAELMRIASFPELSPLPVFELTPAGEATYINPALLALEPELREALLDAARRRLDRSPEALGTLRCDVMGADRWFHLEIQPTPEWGSVRVYAQDITERKQAELSLREAHATLERKVDERTRDLQREVKIRKRAEEAALSASEAKSSFLATMSHELRTPLNAIIGYGELVQEDLGPRSPSSPDLDRILAAARHLLGLINDILDLSKIEAGQMTRIDEVVDVAAAIAEVAAVVTPAARARGDRLELDISSALPRLNTDGRALRQILMNLVGNAVKFTRDGAVTVRAALHEGPTPTLEIAVRDTGIGIPADKLRTIFEPFTQADSSTIREYGGTGLGLTISRKLAELLGGALEVASVVGVGSIFTLRIPAERAEPRSGGGDNDDSAGAPR
ncbi:MAG: PAS domain S-box protein [Myxococcales bacterium]|nr:PAS domain S-box protein [Myxococcales bacterium]